MTDHLAKQFYHHLSQAVGNDRAVWRVLYSNGCNNFIDSERPETNDPVVMARAALLHIGCDNDGTWSNNLEVLNAVIAFLLDETGHTPSREHLERLSLLLHQIPIDGEEIERWFQAAYPNA